MYSVCCSRSYFRPSASSVGIGWQFWINIVLTLVGYIPGVIHAIYVISSPG